MNLSLSFEILKYFGHVGVYLHQKRTFIVPYLTGHGVAEDVVPLASHLDILPGNTLYAALLMSTSATPSTLSVVPLSSCFDTRPGNNPYTASSTSASATPSALLVVPLSSRLDTLLGDNPYSASSMSTSITDSISSSASASHRNPSGSDSFGLVRPARSNAHSRDYRGSF